MKIRSLICLSILSVGLVSCQQQKPKDAYADEVEALLSKMSLAEKIGQLNLLDGSWQAERLENDIRDGHVGSVLNCSGETANQLQRVAVEESRLGIPLLFGRDVIHGFKTIFPIPLGQAASFNEELIEQGSRVAAIEASSVGVRHTYAPMIDVTRDPRWGRVAESLGEDAYLTSRLGVAMVKGLQGDDLTDPSAIAACAKHFAAYGMTEGGRDYNVADISAETLHDYVLPPFKAAADAGCATFMTSFNEINGMPASASKYLFTDLLRDEWNWTGMVVSDYYSIEQLKVQAFCETLDESAIYGINAGVDMDMMSHVYWPLLEDLVKAGKVKESVVDNAVRNVLRLKYQLGLFENPYCDTTRDSVFYAPEHLETAKKLATESVVLLKNEDQVLPLTDNIQSVAVIGPMANAPVEQLGTWCFDAEPEHSVTPLAALTEECGDRVKINYAKGLAYSRDESETEIPAAVAAARRSDVVLLFVGEEAILSGEAKCRADISLPGAQSKLIDEVAKAGKPIVLVVMAGRPLTIGAETEKCAAVLYAFHGGTMAGPALSDLIFGKENPSGKLPITFPKMVGQVPIYYNQKLIGRPAGDDIVLLKDIPVEAKQTSLGFSSYWLEVGYKPLYPFGYGLSYTSFDYKKIQVSNPELKMDGSIDVWCEVKNTGTRPGKETVQLYVQDVAGSATRPCRELKGFKKVEIAPGETEVVSFTITPDMLGFYHAVDGKTYPETGRFNVWIGSSSEGGLKSEFELVK
ncbi:MAG: beta-glucosidase BglX [Paludibacteraceae bacterium]|nr:beta-glucosidase BglX [Paludibacteraceae bacterium]